MKTRKQHYQLMVSKTWHVSYIV